MGSLTALQYSSYIMKISIGTDSAIFELMIKFRGNMGYNIQFLKYI